VLHAILQTAERIGYGAQSIEPGAFGQGQRKLRRQ
jgi:hypothetical protein